MIANVSYKSLFSNSISSTFKTDILSSALFPAVASAIPEWYCARASAFMAPKLGRHYAELVVGSIRSAKFAIGCEREKIGHAGDISATTQLALKYVSAILSHVANWLGHREGLGNTATIENDNLHEALEEWGLNKWLNIFEKDIRNIYAEENRGLNMSVVVGMSRHVERLLWCFGIYAWVEDGEIRAIVSPQAFLAPNLG